jgi:2',3'-cyclic-nucleotide 2'-phosphodiesterase / 3'-nucleotidase / 5'-nucleotidase
MNKGGFLLLKIKRIVVLALLISIFSFTPNANAEIIPTNEFVLELNEPNVSASNIDLTWSLYYKDWRLEWIDQYYINLNNSYFFTKRGQLTGSITKDSYGVTGLLPSTEYEVKVSAVGLQGKIKATDIVKVKTSAHQGWLNLRGRWYYFDSVSGKDKKGWLKDAGSWYYLKDLYWPGEKRNVAAMVSNAWELINGKWYYFNKSGKMVTGWIQYTDRSGASWYYLNPNGDMKTGWLYWNKNWYYLYSNGKMAVNTVIQGYKIGSTGKMIK